VVCPWAGLSGDLGLVGLLPGNSYSEVLCDVLCVKCM